ncbi:aldo/keto reductase [Robbsia sp. KACC 23696]|uniref:aldo/keto reductase n=1 Tax=Robbsia sp. KACC 23696 TaxID=3149231 RepID=UPI00325BD542
MSQSPILTLNDGIQIPQVGLGVWQLDDAQTEAACLAAFDAGYRHIDTAKMYNNEEAVGRALKRTSVPRDEIFITTKLANADQGYDSTLKAFDASMKRLGLEKLDLYLIHWAAPKQLKYKDTWRAFVRLKEEGRVRSIGVCNFNQSHLDDIIADSGVAPSVNQIEIHPDFNQQTLLEFCQSRKIRTEAWSPLGQGGELLKAPLFKQLAQKHGKEPVQVILRWHIQAGHVVIPRSKNPERIKSNFDIFDFTLDDADMKAIASMPQTGRLGPDPETFGNP